MPAICFSYPADAPPGIATRTAGPSEIRRMPYPCFSYPADLPRSMPSACFSYPDRGAVPPSRPSLRRMPHTCFRY